MTILPADHPDNARDAVLAGISQRASARGFATPKLDHAHRTHPGDLQLCAPHRVALLQVSKLRHMSKHKTLAGKVPADLETISLSPLAAILGWRFLIFDTNDPSEPIAAAHAVLTDRGHYRLAELNEGPYVASTLLALQTPSVRQAISSENDKGKSCEPLMLLAPAIYFVGLWIRFQDGDQDFVLPMDSNHLPVFASVKPAELLAVLVRESMKVPTCSALSG